MTMPNPIPLTCPKCGSWLRGERYKVIDGVTYMPCGVKGCGHVTEYRPDAISDVVTVEANGKTSVRKQR